MRSISRKVLFPLLLCLALPLAVMAAWHHLNIGYPQDDCAEYMRHTVRLYGLITSHTESFFHAVYFERIWKPILQSALALPVMFATRGDVLATAAWMAGLYFALSLIYVFLLCRDFVGEWRAAVCTLFVAFTPWFFANAVHFDSEAPFLAFSLAALFHLGRTEKLSRNGQCAAFGIWIGLALCVRPVETLALFSFPILLTAIRALREKSSRSVAPGLLLALGIPLAGAAAWFVPFISDLYGWIYLCTFGEATRALHRNPSFLAWVRTVVLRFLDIPFWILLGVSLPGLLSSERFRQEARKLLGLAAIPVPLILCGAVSYNGDLRYYLSFGLFLSIVVCVFALQPEGRYPRVRAAVVGSLVAVQAFFVLFAIVSSSPVHGCGIGSLLGNGISPVRAAPPSALLFSDLRNLIPRDSRASFASPEQILYLNIPPGAEAMDNQQLEIFSQQDHRYWHFVPLGWFDPIAHLGKQRVDAEMKKRFDYILIGPIEHALDSNRGMRSRFKERLREEIVSGQELSSGFDVVGAFDQGAGPGSRTLVLLCNPNRKACPAAINPLKPVHEMARAAPESSGLSAFSARFLSRISGLSHFLGCD